MRQGTAERGLFLIPLPRRAGPPRSLLKPHLFPPPPFSAQSGNRLAVIPSRRYGCSHLVATHAKSAVAFASAHPDAAAPPGGGDLAGHHAVRYLSLPDAAFIRFLTGHTAPVTSLALHPANDTLLSASRDDSVRLWDLRSPVCSGRMAVPGAPTVAADRQGLVFAVGVAGGVIKLFDSRQYDAGPFSIITVGGGGGGGGAGLAGAAPPPAPPPPGSTPPAAGPRPPAPAGFSDLAFSPSGVLLAAVAGCDVWSLDAYDGSTRNHINTSGAGGGGEGVGGAGAAGAAGAAAAHPPPTRATGPPGGQAAFSPDDNYLIAGCANGTVGAWASGLVPAAAGMPAVWAGGGGQAFVLRWSPTRQCVAAAGGGALALWVPWSGGVGAAGA